MKDLRMVLAVVHAAVLVLVSAGGVTGQDGRSRTDSVYTWLLMERSAREQIVTEADQFDHNFYQVFMDSLRVEGVPVYRLLLGRYETREAALHAEVAIPLTLRSDARLVHLSRDALGPVPQGVSEPAGRLDEPADTTAADTSRGAPAAEASQDDNEVEVYLDCASCDSEHVRREVTFVNWVRDREDANVHLLVTTRSAAAGREYTLYFIGLGRFQSLADTLRFVSSNTDTFSERRTQLGRRIELGLVRYVAQTAQVERISVVKGGLRPYSRPPHDAWKSWTFRISGNGSYDEEEATRSFQFGGTVAASRITDEWKVQIVSTGNYAQSEFELKDSVLKSTRRSGSFSGQAVKSLSDRWSAGLFTGASTSSFRNTNFSATLAPALEFNIFPYSESTRREFRFAYYLNLRSFDYEEITVFGKTSERVLHHDLQAILQSKEPWGSAYFSFSVSNYLTDFEDSLTDLYRVESYAYLEVRLVRGLSVWGEVTASRIRDQIFLPLKTATEEEILLGTIQLPTDFQLRFAGGLTFTFGSIYNNVVNARFGS